MIDKIKSAVINGNIEWQKHALERMLERGIATNSVKEVLLRGDIIETYPTDKPYSSYLIAGIDGLEVFHVVVALDEKSEICYIITAYRPDLKHFKSDLKTRRT